MTAYTKSLSVLFALVLAGVLLFGLAGDRAGQAPDNGAPAASSGLIAPAAAQGTPNPLPDAGPDRTAAVGDTVVLDGSASTDPKGVINDFTWTITQKPAGSTAALDDPAAVKPRFTVDLAGDYVIQLVTSDPNRQSAPDSVIISTTGSAPVADAGPDQAIGVAVLVTLDGSGSSDFDGDALSYGWTLVQVPAGSTAALSDPAALQPSFTADLAGTYVAELVVTAGGAGSAADTVTVSTDGVAPVAEAGGDITALVSLIAREQLDGSRSHDADGEQLDYKWDLISDPPPSIEDLASQTGPRPTLLVDQPGLFLLQLTITDDSGNERRDTLVVSTVNSAPVAGAGAEQSVAAGDTVRLDGAGSVDDDGDLLSFRWALVAKPAGSTAALDDPTAVRPSFTADLAGTYVAQLIVKDGEEFSAPDTVLIATANTRPVAAAGPPQTIVSNQVIQLDATGSRDADNDTLTYRWSVMNTPNGSMVVFSDPTAANPTVTISKFGEHVLQVVVSDGVHVDIDTVLLSNIDTRPFAVANQNSTVTPGAPAQLDASASFDVDNNPLAFFWALIAKPEGSAAVISDPAAASPSFTPDLAGDYVAQLIVREISVTANNATPKRSLATHSTITANAPPVANAGPDATVALGATAQLDGGASSDPDGDPLTFAWQFTGRPAGSTAVLANADIATPSFTPDVTGNYVVQLVVNDGTVDSAPDTATIITANEPPVAEAGPDQSVTLGAQVALDGGASSDPEGQALAFSWRFIARPEGSAAALSDTAIANPTFTPDLAGFYVAELTVTDPVGASSLPDTVAIRVGTGVVNAPPVLGAIGNKTVTLGQQLNFFLTGSDPDDATGASLFFFAQGMPPGATLETLEPEAGAAKGLFRFDPVELDVGVYNVTFFVNDGFASDSETIDITVVRPPAFTATRLDGFVVDAVAAAAGLDVPVVGATVKILGSSLTSVTNVDGLFRFRNGPTGDLVLFIDASTATPFPDPAPDGTPYASLIVPVNVIAKAVNLKGKIYRLARIDLSGSVAYDPADPNPTVVSNATLGATLTVAAGSATAGGTPYTGTISLSQAPTAQFARSLPPNISPCHLITVQSSPSGALFSPPAVIALGNPDNLPAASQVDIWLLRPGDSAFSKAGIGTVSADGLSIATSVGIASTLTYLFAVPAAPTPVAASDHNDTSRTPTALADGNRTASVTLAGFRSLGQVRAHTFTYNSTSADPRPIVAAEVTFPAATGLPPLLEGRLEVNNVRVAGPVFTSTVLRDTRDDAALPALAAGGTIRQALQFDASDLATGDHGFRYVASAKYDCSKVGAAVDGRLVLANNEASPFGAGWTLNGLQKLIQQPDGRVVIDEGDGTVKSFDNRFLPGVGQPVPWPLAMAVDDFNGDTHLDAAVPMGDFGTVQIFLGDGKGNLTFLVEYDSGIDDRPEGAGRAPDAEYIATGDFNGDLHRDLAVVNQLSDRIQIFPGIGDGTFGPPGVISVAQFQRPQAVAVADFNQDGFEDLAVATSAGLSLSSRTWIFFGDGTGAFPVWRSFDTGRFQTAIQVADFNNDFWPDIAVLATQDQRELTIMTNDRTVDPTTGMNGFSPIVILNGGPVRFTAGRFGLAVADYDGDGNQDVAVSNAREDINIFWGDGAGAMPTNSGALTPGVGETSSLRALDVDKDGSPDIVMSSRTFGTVGVLLYDGARRFVSGPVTPVTDPGVGVSAIQPGDFDEDGSADLVASVGNADDDASKKLFVLKGGNDRFHPPGGDFSRLTRNGDGTFERRMTDGTVFVFDADGQLTSRTDRNGNVTNYTYDLQGRIASISDPADPTRSTAFDFSTGTITDVATRQTFFLVDANGQLTAVTNPDGSVRRFVHDANNRLISQASERGFVTTQDYGFAGQWIGSGFPDGASISAQISKSLGLADLGIGLGTETNPLPYARPNETATLNDALGNVYKMRFNAFSAVVEVTDPILRNTILTRDADNLVTRVDAPSDGELPDGGKPGRVITEIDYDASGNVIAQREAVGTVLQRQTRFEYEPEFNRVTKIADPSNSDPVPQCGTAGVTCFAYDANGNQTQVTAFVNGAAFTQQSATYDARGLQETRTDANGNPTAFFYNTLGLLNRLVDAELNETGFAYDPAGNLKTRTQGVGTVAERVTSFTYDAMNRMLTETDGAGGTTTTRYDAAGNVVATEDANGIVVARAYDERNRLTEENNPATGSAMRTYDANGNLKTITNALGNTVALVYDPVNRVERTTDPLLKDRLFSYDAQNNRSTVTDARGNATTLAFNLPTGKFAAPTRCRCRRSRPSPMTVETTWFRRKTPRARL